MIAIGALALSWNLSAAQITSTCSASIQRAQARERSLLQLRGRRTFDSVVLPLENLNSDLNDETIAQTFLFEVALQKDVRDASLQCGNDETAFSNDLQANPTLYAELMAAKRSGTALTVYDRKLTDDWIDTFKRSGAGLSAKNRAEFVKLSNQLNDLQNQYQANLANDQTTITITRGDAGSLPADFVAGLKRQGAQYIVPVNESTAPAFLDDEKNEDARRAYLVAYDDRQATVNTDLLERAIALRDRLAHLLGYENWAVYQLSDRMAKSPERVMKFLNELDAALLPKARSEIAVLTSLKAKDTNDRHAVLNPWDYPYYDTMLRKTQYAVDENQVRQYFPVQHTIDAVLDIYRTLLGIDFKRVTPADAWNPDVIEYSVSDSHTGKFIGLSFFDLYPRPGKYGHFANFPLLPLRREPDGSVQAPISAIVGNWPKPAPGEPALLSHEDVVTFFHEFGHNLATLLATAPYETLSQPFIRDFVEAPSQMLENFVWQPAILKQISSNWKTGAPLPDDLIAAMVRARYVDHAYDTTQDIKRSEADVIYHTSGPHVDTTAVWAQLSSKLTPMAPIQGSHPQAGFIHLMAGYDAGYYGYLWSQVYAQDLFTAFEQGGIENSAVGMRYRQDILQPSRTFDPDAEVRRFLGRPMSPKAFYQQFDEVTTP